MKANNNRRSFLKYMGRSTLALSAIATLPGCQQNKLKRQEGLFPGLNPSLEDDLLLAPNFDYHIVAKWGEALNSKGEKFGFNCDFTSFVPFRGKVDEGLLWVNHEFVIPSFVHRKNESELKNRTRSQMIAEQKEVGGSIIHIRKRNNQWKLVKNSKYNRRLDGRTPIPFSHNFKIQGSKKAYGTLANCSGGQTPWRTILTSEENYHNFYGDIQFDEKGNKRFVDSQRLGWNKHFPLPPEHYGWVVEVDPFTGKAKKQVLLGRAAHEGATPVLTKKKKAVVYMGEDTEGGFIYKFVSTGAHLNKGKLYAADTVKGRWLLLDYDKDPRLNKYFSSQLEVLTYSHKAAEILGATPQDRPEDIEVDPKTNNIIVALTNNKNKKNFYGSLLKITEAQDFDSTTFQSEHWINGGYETGFSCPDNFAFDNKGNLWMTVDISEKVIDRGPYKGFGNNGLFYIPLSGPKAGIAIQVASAPADAELTGPWFSPDYKTLFLSVQHPGALSRFRIDKPTSQWPDGPGKLPKSSVIALQGKRLTQLTQ